MKSLKSRLKKHEITITNTDWNKYDDRLMKAVERAEVEKVNLTLSKKGLNPTKLDVEGRSAFHVAASKGYLDCLNAMLNYGVDITAADSSGRNAMHLAAKYGQSLCLQKLLQYNCPTENVDVQGRTPLHVAAMAGCVSSVRLLCDHGASVNAKDGEGRTPLILATQMCRPQICQLLIEQGADVNAKDKRNRTALMLGCEYSCKDAADVLLKNGADPTLLDSFGHDCFYYAKLTEDTNILNLVKAAVESSSKGKEHSKKEQHHQQQKAELVHAISDTNVQVRRDVSVVKVLEAENEDLKEKMKKFHQEQGLLLDKVNVLQQQVNQERVASDGLQKEREHLKTLLSTKEREHDENLKTIDTLQFKIKTYENEFTGVGGPFYKGKDDSFIKQRYGMILETQPAPVPLQAQPQSRSVHRPLELSVSNQASVAENEMLKKDLETLKKKYEEAKEEISRLQNEVSIRVTECNSLGAEGRKIKEESDKQIRQLEDALNDVQKRMFESEGKVKHLQSYVVALKDHLTSEGSTEKKTVESLKEQLLEYRTKYEGASAEIERLHNLLKQETSALEDLKNAKEKVEEDSKCLLKELSMSMTVKSEAERKIAESEAKLKKTEEKLAQCVPSEKFENMKSLLTNAVDVKEKQCLEVRDAKERVEEENRLLKREIENHRSKMSGYVILGEYEKLKTTSNHRIGELEKEISELLNRNLAVQKELEKNQHDNNSLKQQLQDLTNAISTQYIFLKSHNEMKQAFSKAIDELNRKNTETTAQYKEVAQELEQVKMQKENLSQNVTRLQAQSLSSEKQETEMSILKANVAELKRQIELINQKCSELEREKSKLLSEHATLNKSMHDNYVPFSTHSEIKASLSKALDAASKELSEKQKLYTEAHEELTRLKGQNVILKNKVEEYQQTIQKEYIKLKDHEEIKIALNNRVNQLETTVSETEIKYERARDETLKLHREIEAQKEELDTIHDCIKSKFVPVTVLGEKQNALEAKVQELTNKLIEQTQRSESTEKEAVKYSKENENLKQEILMLNKKIECSFIPRGESEELQRHFKEGIDDLKSRLQDLTQKYTDVKHEREALKEENARYLADIHTLQNRMQGEYIVLDQFEAMKKTLNSSIEELRDELEKAKVAYQNEAEVGKRLQQALDLQKERSVPLMEYLQMKEASEIEILAMKERCKTRDEEMNVKLQEISALKSEIQSSSRALSELESKDVIELSEYRAMRNELETQIATLNENVASVNKKYNEMCEEAVRVKRDELAAKDEKETLKSRSLGIEQEIKELKERYDKSLATISDLQRRIQESTKQIEAKDNKIRELLDDAEKLKQALNGLSQLTYTSSTPMKRQNQHIETLQNQVKNLQQQLADAEGRHREVISIYRTHLLSAAQGHMDKDVQAALLQIIQMREELVC